MTQPAVALVGALDTKGEEYSYLRDRLRDHNIESVLIDIGVLGVPTIQTDVTRESVAEAAGLTLADLIEAADRDHAMQGMARGARAVVSNLLAQGSVSGLFVMGGSNAGYAMSVLTSALPFGFPKMLVSTIVSGDTRLYVSGSDLAMMYPVEDIAGINSISRSIIDRAAAAIAGMVLHPPTTVDAPSTAIGLSMFGVTTACVTTVATHIRERGWEPHVFHATGTGGLSLESLIAGGHLSAVVDVTTTELADELVGGVCTAGQNRLTAAARGGIPQVVSPGALDMVNFGSRDTLPERYQNRTLFAHNPAVTLMRTSPDENAELGAIMARKLNTATAPVEIHIPARGFSQISVVGGIFHDPAADRSFIEAVQRDIRVDIPVYVHELSINDPEFASIVFSALQRVLTLGEGTQ